MPSLEDEIKYLLDPVIWARDMLDFQPDPWQEQVLRSGSRRLILNCSRQSGKSTVTAILALHRSIWIPRSLVLLISPSLRQSSELFRKVMSWYRVLEDAPKVELESTLRVELENGSRIISLPGQEETIRGYSGVDLLIADEAARIPDELYYSVRPMLAVSGGKMVLLSTPYGKRGFFYEIWERGEEWEKFQITAEDCPRISKEFLEEEARSMPRAWFLQEYYCQFVSSAGARIKREWLKYEDRAPSQGMTIAMGVDLAISTKAAADWTAAVVLGRGKDGIVHVLDAQRIKASFREQQVFIRQLAEKWQPAAIGIEDVAYQRAMVQEMSSSTSLPVVGIKADTDKISRFAPIEARYELGQVVHQRDLPAAFEQELLSFPVGVHDDQIDAMSVAWAALNRVLGKPVFKIPERAIKR